METAASVLVSYEQSLLRPESSLEEVINGELHSMPPASFAHNQVINHLQELFYAEMDAAYTLAPGTGFLIEERPRLRYRIPDVAVIERQAAKLSRRERTQRDPYARFAPVSIIEVLSPSNRKGDVGQLLADYRDLGVAEVLLIDPEAQTVRHFKDNAEMSVGSQLVVARGVAIHLDQVWREFEGL